MGSSAGVGDGTAIAAVPAPSVVAVGVRKGSSRSSRRAVQWAIDNLMPQADRFRLLHVAPPVTAIPTPAGNRIPIEQMNDDVAAIYMQDIKLKTEEIFLPFKRLCRTRQIETLILNGDDPSTALLRYISEMQTVAISLVLGSSSRKSIIRKLKGSDVPSTVLELAPNTCNIYVVSRHKLITKMATTSIVFGGSTKSGRNHPKKIRQMIIQRKFDKRKGSSHSIYKRISGFYSAYMQRKRSGILEVLTEPDGDNSDIQEQILGDNGHDKGALTMDIPLTRQQSTKLPEVERLRIELQDTLVMYNKACENLVHARNKVQILSAECSEEARKVRDAREREEVARKLATEEKAKNLEAIKEVALARQMLAKEAHERKRAEMLAIKESSERKKMLDALLMSDQRYKRYSREEIEVATGCFSESNKIGEGGYGVVYKCTLDHTPVAVKVLRQDASDKKEEFLREVEILSQIRHPHMVMLLGACPENGCLVYEYMENGSLDDQLFRGEGTLPPRWFIRFRIVFEVGSALAFLHSSKPEPVIHRDLKPGNILLDGNYVSKIGDVGMAQLMSNVVPDGVTEYRDTVLAGTLYYMDPEYQRTGTLRPKSDLYAFGIIILQLLTAKHPLRLLQSVESAIDSGSFADLLDKSVTDWPLAESKELAHIALKCCRLRCRDRPDLETEVMPELKRFMNMADANIQLQSCKISVPTYYFCPILQEVMEDPHVAADGFTYEYRAIKAWLEKHNVSPVTKLRFPHSWLTPNHTLRSAIQEWNSRATSSGS